ncbi:MAG: Ger(x)C family spore germination C-terminal domain-containing protein [Clostridium sp.]|nr:MAG: Ger(x)C family spore germination C-terminal domain-containing protein [Clostridium sp.]
MSDIDLNNKNIQEITDNINKEISDKTKEFTDKLILNNSDILGFKKIYYNKKRSKLKSINNIEYEVKVKVSLNRKRPYIFYSLGGEYEKNQDNYGALQFILSLALFMGAGISNLLTISKSDVWICIILGTILGFIILKIFLVN